MGLGLGVSNASDNCAPVTFGINKNSIGFPNGYYSSNEEITQKNPNPDPFNFVITSIRKSGNFVIAWINYPNCTNYEGDKILVFHNVSLTSIVNLKKLDPHFTDKGISPIARFEPTDRGWNWAVDFCNTSN